MNLQPKVLITDPVLEVIEDLEDVEIMEGEKASFSCRLSLEDVEVVWKLNGEEIKPIENR